MQVIYKNFAFYVLRSKQGPYCFRGSAPLKSESQKCMAQQLAIEFLLEHVPTRKIKKRSLSALFSSPQKILHPVTSKRIFLFRSIK